MPLDSIPIKMLDIPFEFLNTGPEVRVRYMNTDMIKDINQKEIWYNTWAFTNLKRKFWNTNTKDRINTISSLGIMSNIGIISCLTLGSVTSVITQKTIMPYMIMFISVQKLYTSIIMETSDSTFRWYLQYFKFSYLENSLI